MKRLGTRCGALASALLMFGCASGPMQPSVAVMPGPNKPFDVFQQDQAVCKQYAEQQVGGPNAAANAASDQAVAGAAVGTLLGAAAGALIGHSGGAAATGAGVGLIGGAAVGGANASQTAGSVQHRYDVAYEQCMYSRGNQLPQPRYVAAPPTVVYTAPPPPPTVYYPPPPGAVAAPPPPPPPPAQ